MDMSAAQSTLNNASWINNATNAWRVRLKCCIFSPAKFISMVWEGNQEILAAHSGDLRCPRLYVPSSGGNGIDILNIYEDHNLPSVVTWHLALSHESRLAARSRHSRRMRNPQCYVSGKRPMNASACQRCSCIFSAAALRAGQDQGGPRWDTLTKKSKSTKLLHIVLCYTQGVVAYDPVLFGGCIAPPLTPLQVKPEALILISIGGRTLQCGVMYIFFYVLVLPKLTFITYCGIKSRGLYKNTKKK